MSGRSMSVLERVLVALALWVQAPAAADACDASITPVVATLRLDYDPFAFVRNAARLAVDIENDGADACPVDVVLLDAARVSIAQSDVGNTGVQIGFVASAAGTNVAATTLPGVWRLTLDPAARTRFTIDTTVLRDAVATAGEHDLALTLELRDAGTAIAHGSAIPIRVSVVAPPRAQMNIVGSAGAFGEGASVAHVDFGVFENDARRRVYLQVRANTRGRLTIDSANRGRLLRNGDQAGETGIPYAASLADRTIDLTSHWEEVIDPPQSIAGTSLPLDLMVSTIGSHAEGTYSDVLTVELSAL